MGLRFLFSYRLQQFIDTTHVLRALLKLARQTRAYAHNPEFVGILTQHLHIAKETDETRMFVACA